MILIQFTTADCNPCSILKLSMEQVPLPKGVELAVVNLKTASPMTSSYNVRTVPTLILTTDAYQELGRTTGAKTPKQLGDWYKEMGLEI